MFVFYVNKARVYRVEIIFFSRFYYFVCVWCGSFYVFFFFFAKKNIYFYNFSRFHRVCLVYMLWYILYGKLYSCGYVLHYTNFYSKFCCTQKFGLPLFLVQCLNIYNQGSDCVAMSQIHKNKILFFFYFIIKTFCYHVANFF